MWVNCYMVFQKSVSFWRERNWVFSYTTGMNHEVLPLSKTNRGEQQRPWHWSFWICFKVILAYKAMFLMCSYRGSLVSLHPNRMWCGLSWFSFPHITFYHVPVSSLPFYSCPICLPYLPVSTRNTYYIIIISYHINSQVAFSMCVIITRVLLLRLSVFLDIKVHCRYFDFCLTRKDLYYL